MKQNKEKCDDYINAQLGVANWEKVNFSQDEKLAAKFDSLVKKCE
jgi:hypothetical protein